MSWRPDPEIDELFDELDERRLAQALRTVHAPEVTPDAAFRSQLRRQLMEEAWKQAEPRLGWWQRLWAPQRAAWAMALVGAVLIALVVYSTSGGARDRTVVIHSNVEGTQLVAAVQPIQLSFSQPMNRQSVESALHIQPATAVAYRWTSDTQVTIVPTSGSFAPNTQYTVSLADKVAQTQQGTVVPAATTAVFTVAPKPTPAPTPAPTPTPSPALKLSVLGPAGDARPQWNYQGKIAALGPNGELELFPIDGGSPEVLVPSGVTAFALSPDGGKQVVAYLQAGQAFQHTARSVPVSAAGAGAIAVGATATAVEYATTGSVFDGQGHETKLQVPATTAWFAPGGARLLYQAADRSLHLVDLAAGTQTAWPAPGAATTFLGWSADGAKVLYTTSDGVFTADPADQSPARLGTLPAATAADWPASGPLVVQAAGSLHRVAADGSGDRVLGTAHAAALAAGPNGAVALTGGGQLALAQAPSAPGAAALSVDSAASAVGAFEKARMAGDAAGAAAVVASNARSIAPAPTGIQRWFTVSSFLGSDGVHARVRVVLADKAGKDTSQLDESLLVVPGADGSPAIASVSDAAVRDYGKGPEVLAVSLTGGSLAVEFDSDLTAATVPLAMKLTDAAGKPVAAGASTNGRTVTITPATPLAPGTYRLAVTTALLDSNARPAAAEFDLDIPVLPS